jgi:hypothetical protein
MDVVAESGLEVYRNWAIGPHVGLTLSVPVIEPAIRALDTAVVPGLRLNLKF